MKTSNWEIRIYLACAFLMGTALLLSVNDIRANQRTAIAQQKQIAEQQAAQAVQIQILLADLVGSLSEGKENKAGLVKHCRDLMDPAKLALHFFGVPFAGPITSLVCKSVEFAPGVLDLIPKFDFSNMMPQIPNLPDWMPQPWK